MDRSWVSMEQHVCVVCGKTYNTGSLLLDKQVRKSLDPVTVTGNGLCPEHQKLSDKGYLALVVTDRSKSRPQVNGRLKLGDEYRTGEIIHIRRTVAAKIFNVDIPATLPMVFIDDDAARKLEKMKEEADEHDTNSSN